MEKTDRRQFLRQSLLVMGAAGFGPAFLSSCLRNGYEKLVVLPEQCTACGNCADVCRYAAILLDEQAVYSIDPQKCNLCNACLSSCQVGAISIPGVTYSIDMSICTSCGECLSACTNQEAILVEFNPASINQNRCMLCEKCIEVCSSAAIVYES